MTEIKCSEDYSTIKELFVEYSQIKGAEGCFVSFDRELADLKGYYKDGAIILGYEDDIPFGCIAIKKEDDDICRVQPASCRLECLCCRLHCKTSC